MYTNKLNFTKLQPFCVNFIKGYKDKTLESDERRRCTERENIHFKKRRQIHDNHNIHTHLVGIYQSCVCAASAYPHSKYINIHHAYNLYKCNIQNIYT